jgi:hypothetical protein
VVGRNGETGHLGPTPGGCSGEGTGLGNLPGGAERRGGDAREYGAIAGAALDVRRDHLWLVHPGGNITGLPGYNCAQVVLADLGLPAPWAPPPVEPRLEA